MIKVIKEVIKLLSFLLLGVAFGPLIALLIGFTIHALLLHWLSLGVSGLNELFLVFLWSYLGASLLPVVLVWKKKLSKLHAGIFFLGTILATSYVLLTLYALDHGLNYPNEYVF